MPAPSPLLAYLKIQQATDTEVLRHLHKASNNIDVELRKLTRTDKVGQAVRREQLLLSKVAINQELDKMWSNVGHTVQAQSARAAAAGAQTILDGSESTLSSLFSKADREMMVASARLQAERGVSSLLERASGTSRIQLSEKVYQTAAFSKGKIDLIVNNALARGASASELARDVRAYVNPNTPGGVRYASMRLARTEINNAFHASQIREGQKSPFVTGLLWNLSGSHPKPDECNIFAEHDGTGIFRPEEVPGKPHPNCLCYLTPETPSIDDFVKQYQNGTYDSYLGERLPDGPQDLAPPAPVGPFSQFARMAPQVYKEAVHAVNPGTGPSYQNNCHYVTNAMEMRARGYDVVASQTFKSTGRHLESIVADWEDPVLGGNRGFTRVMPKDGTQNGYVNVTRIKEVTDRWPPGARGFVVGDWRSGGAHIFSVYKDEKGAIKLVDGQVDKANVSAYLDKMKNVNILRVDDLEPVEKRVSESITHKLEPVTAESQKTKLLEMIAMLEDDVRMFGTQRLRFQLAQLRDELKKLP